MDTTVVQVATMGLQTLSLLLGAFIGYIGILIILVGCVRGLFLFVSKILFKKVLLSDIRIELGHYLALGLEFLMGKDIIESLVEPTWDALGKLAVIIILRTAVTLFLAHEVKEVREELEEESKIRALKKSFRRAEEEE